MINHSRELGQADRQAIQVEAPSAGREEGKLDQRAIWKGPKDGSNNDLNGCTDNGPKSCGINSTFVAFTQRFLPSSNQNSEAHQPFNKVVISSAGSGREHR